MDDQRIVDLFLERDETAIEQTSGKYGKRLFSLAYGIVMNHETAEECENDTYLKAWNSIPPHEPREYLYAFLARITRRIALNCCRDRMRLKRNAAICEISTEMEQFLPAPDDVEKSIDRMVLTETINRFLGSLTEEKRCIFVRRYWYADPVSAIAKRYSISESKVKTVLFRSREQLRERLRKEGVSQ